MKKKSLAAYALDGVRVGLASVALMQFSVGAQIASARPAWIATLALLSST